MLAKTPKVQRLQVTAQNTRRNFRPEVSRKRGESNFLRAFERAYLARLDASGFVAGEFALPGYGVADLVWIGWNTGSNEEDFTAFSVEKRLHRRHLFAFEAKLKDWRRALQQAFRYRYFSDKAIVLMPFENVGPALEALESFRQVEIGLWSFERKTETIRQHFTPTKVKALNKTARTKAISLISSKVDLRKLRE